jgi:hemerythrin-like metal-binding protein
MNRYKLKGQELQKYEHLKICEFLDNMKLEEKDIPKFKAELLTQLLKHISITDYKLINTEEHTNNLLLNATTKAEIEWLIYKTKYPEIDEDHVKFIDFVLDFTHLRDKASSKKELLEIISKGTSVLYKYAKDHFEHEKKIMDNNPNLPEIEEHKLKHKEILDVLTQIKYYIDNQKVNYFTILRSKILNIWIHHTNTMDQITFNS